MVMGLRLQHPQATEIATTSTMWAMPYQANRNTLQEDQTYLWEITVSGGAKSSRWREWALRPSTHLSARSRQLSHPGSQSLLPPKVWMNMPSRLGSPGRPQPLCRQS